MEWTIDKESMKKSNENLKKAIDKSANPSFLVDPDDIQINHNPQKEMREGLIEEYPDTPDVVISSIFHTINREIGDFDENEKKCYDACKVCLENGITTDELDLLKTVFENGLESATWKGISVIKMSESLEIRGKQTEKLLDNDEMVKLKSVFVERLPEFNSISTPEYGEPITMSWGGGGNGSGNGNSTSIDTVEFSLKDARKKDAIGYIKSKDD